MIKLLCVDLDGTLLNSSGIVTKETIEAIRKGRRYGIKVCITTGRNIPRVEAIAKQLDGFKYDDYIICLNGAKIYRFSNDVINEIQSNVIDEEMSQLVFKKATDLGAVAVGYGSRGEKFYTNKKLSPLSIILRRQNNLQLVKYKGERLLDEQISKFIIKANKVKIEKLKKFLAKKEFEICAASYASDKAIEVNAKNINKLSGIKFVAKELGIEAKDIAYFGDGENDLKALKWVGQSYAMANASDEIKEAAKFRAQSNDENGIVEPLEKYIEELESQTVSSNTILSDELANTPEEKTEE